MLHILRSMKSQWLFPLAFFCFGHAHSQQCSILLGTEEGPGIASDIQLLDATTMTSVVATHDFVGTSGSADPIIYRMRYCTVEDSLLISIPYDNIIQELAIQNDRIAIVGYTDSALVYADLYIVDTAFNLIQHKKWKDSVRVSFKSVDFLDNGNIICGGLRQSANGVDILLVMFDPNGNELWRYMPDRSRTNYIQAVRTKGNHVYYALDQERSNGTYEYEVGAMDEFGNAIWNTPLTFANNAGCQNLTITGEGDLLLCGESDSPQSFYFDMFVTRLDSNGSVIDHDLFPVHNQIGDAAFDVEDLGWGNYLITGYGSGGAFGTDAVTQWVDLTGAILQQWKSNAPGLQNAYGIVRNAEGQFCVCGESGESGVKEPVVYCSSFAGMGLPMYEIGKNQSVLMRVGDVLFLEPSTNWNLINTAGQQVDSGTGEFIARRPGFYILWTGKGAKRILIR